MNNKNVNNTSSKDKQLEIARAKMQKRKKIKLYKRIGIGVGSIASAALIIVGIKLTNTKKNDKLYDDTTSQTSNVTSIPDTDDKNINDITNDNNSQGNEDLQDTDNQKDPFDLKTSNVSSLGVELTVPSKETPKVEYSNPSDGIDETKIVEDEDKTLWVNSEAESKKEDIDKVVVDTNNGEYVQKDDGKVQEKEPSYQIVDDSGKVVDEGTGDISNDYVWDNEIGKYLPKDEVGKYILDSDGNMWLKEDYEKYQEELKNSETVTSSSEFIPTTPTEVETEFIPLDSQNSNTPSESSLYVDPFTELVFESKEDYEQWVLQDFEGYGILNGVMVAKTEEMLEADKKALTR